MQQKIHIQTENKVVLSYAVKWEGGKGGGRGRGAQKTKTFAALEVLIGLRDQNYCRVLYRDPAKTSRLSIKNYKYSMQFKKYEGSQT